MEKLKVIIIFLLCSLSAIAIYVFKGSAYDSITSKEISDKHFSYTNLIAHACGAYNGIAYTNSLNALESNYEKGFRVFEVDFSLTSDKEVVLFHDGEMTVKDLFGSDEMKYTREKFIKAKTKYNLDLMDMDILSNWLEEHKDAYVIIDYKNDGTQILKSICEKYGEMLQRFYVQIYAFEEYSNIKRMGFEKIILTLYKASYSDEDIMKFVGDNDVYAVTMPVYRAESGLPMKLKKINVKVFAHTVNSKEKYRKLLANGVYGIYTDYIPPLESVPICPLTTFVKQFSYINFHFV
jgi:Glycerophosphoryl diester phosphodiesterase